MVAKWRCFHCDDVFGTRAAAVEHFGTSEVSQPACQIDIGEYRRMEALHARHLSEDSDADREYHRLRADADVRVRRAEEQGYERGLSDGRSLALLPGDQQT